MLKTHYILWELNGPYLYLIFCLLHLGMLCAKFGWNWSSGSGKRFSKFVNVFLYFVIIPLYWGHGPLSEQIWIHVTQGCFVSCLVEISAIKFHQYIFGWFFLIIWQNIDHPLSKICKKSKILLEQHLFDQLVLVKQYAHWSDLINGATL